MLSLFPLKYNLRTHILHTYIPEIMLTINIFSSYNNYNKIIIVILSWLKRKLRQVVPMITQTRVVSQNLSLGVLSPKSVFDHMEHCFPFECVLTQNLKNTTLRNTVFQGCALPALSFSFSFETLFQNHHYIAIDSDYLQPADYSQTFILYLGSIYLTFSHTCCKGIPGST